MKKHFLKQPKKPKTFIFIIILIIFHLAGNLIWQYMDNTPPGWDPAVHTIKTINYAQYLLRKGINFNLIELFQMSDYYPILTYLTGVPLALISNFNNKVIQLTGTFFFILSLISLYTYVKTKFKNTKLAFLTTFLFSFFITIAETSKDHMLDLPVVAMILLTLLFLEKFKNTKKPKFLYLFFVFFGLSQNTKWYAFIYLSIPLIFTFYYFLQHKFFNKKNYLHLVLGFLLFIFISIPWYLINLNIILDRAKFAWTGEKVNWPSLFSLETLFYHLKHIIIFEISFAGFLLLLTGLFFLIKSRSKHKKELIITLAANYLFFTLVPNKNIRYVIPLMPFTAIVMGYGLNKLIRVKNYLLKIFSFIIIIYYPFSYLVLFFAMPFYPKYKHVVKFPIIGWVDVYYLADYPVNYVFNHNAVWPQKEIIRDLSTMKLKENISVFVDTDRLTFNAYNLKLLALSLGKKQIDFSCPYNQLLTIKKTEEIESYLNQFDYALIPKKEVIGEDKEFISFTPLTRIQNYFLSGKASFRLIKSYYLPTSQTMINDEDELLLYQRRF